MSWQAATLGLLLLCLAGGIGWYERSRPPARMVALVAALAALAIAGRLAFVPIPNVVATTDIVLFTGYGLGAGPGFAVGALAALVSNLWLGQGPWTPWEMTGWGLVGVAGAGLGRLTGRRVGRVGLAVACGLAGFAYGALLDLSVMVSYGGEQSLDRYLAISARGVPFNVAHATGNVALALAAGPALVRLIGRYRERFEFTWAPAAAGAGVVVAALVLAAGWAPQPARAAQGAAGWLVAARNSDGGFGADSGERSSPAMTGWAMLGLEGAGVNPLDVNAGSHNPVTYLRANASRIHSTGDLERTILALVGAGVGSHSFGGQDLVAELRSRRDADGSFDGQVNLTAFGILALRAAGAPASALAAPGRWLRSAENRDGGWGFQPGAPSDADSTGAALQGMAAAGVRSLAGGVRYLRRVQDGDGGYPISGGSTSNSQSTAWAVQGLVAAGANPRRLVRHGRSPLDYLASRQAADGHYEYSAASDQTPVWVTAQALLAVRRRALPIAAVRRAPAPARSGAYAHAGGDSSGQAGTPQPTTTAQVPSATGRSGPAGHGGALGPARHHGRGRWPHRARPSAPRGVPADGAHRPVPAEFPSASPPASSHAARDIAVGFGGTVAIIAGGFLWYRRRLP